MQKKKRKMQISYKQGEGEYRKENEEKVNWQMSTSCTENELSVTSAQGNWAIPARHWPNFTLIATIKG